MLGTQIGEIRGHAISTRILPDEGHGPRMEITDQQTGTLCGENVTLTITYVGTLRPNGTLAGYGEGIAMTTSGEGATFKGIGAGRFTRPGATSWRGALCFESAAASLSRLNGIAVLFEYEVDESGKSEGKLYEWS